MHWSGLQGQAIRQPSWSNKVKVHWKEGYYPLMKEQIHTPLHMHWDGGTNMITI